MSYSLPCVTHRFGPGMDRPAPVEMEAPAAPAEIEAAAAPVEQAPVTVAKQDPTAAAE